MALSSLSPRNLRGAGTALLALYVLAGVVYSVSLAPVTHFVDEKEYLTLGTHLAQGTGFSMDGVHPTATRPPGYPFFIAGILAMGGGIVALRIANFLLLAGTVLLLAALAGGTAARLVVTWLVLFYPVLFYVAGTLYAQTLGNFLFAAALVLLFTRPGRTWPALGGGGAFGALILTVPTFALTFFIVLLLGARLRLLSARSVALAVLGAIVLMLPWTLRNFATFHRFVPLASNSGMNLLLGNNATTLPYGGGENGSVQTYLDEANARHFGEFDGDSYFRDAALRWIGAHPGQAALLYVEKVANFFNIWNEYAPENGREISGWKQDVMAASYLLLLGLTGWRLVEARRGFPLLAWEKLFLLVYLASAFTMAIFLTRIRLRLPYDDLLIAVVAGHICRRWPALSRRET